MYIMCVQNVLCLFSALSHRVGALQISIIIIIIYLLCCIFIAKQQNMVVTRPTFRLLDMKQ